MNGGATSIHHDPAEVNDTRHQNDTSDTCPETRESLQAKARQFAKLLVASVLANSVAQCIRMECDSTGDRYRQSISELKVSVNTVKVTVEPIDVVVAHRFKFWKRESSFVANRWQIFYLCTKNS